MNTIETQHVALTNKVESQLEEELGLSTYDRLDWPLYDKLSPLWSMVKGIYHRSFLKIDE